jgi:alanine dehydrogenase
MKIGVPKEIKNHEYRVGLTPASVREFVAHGHSVMVQAGAGAAIGLDDAQYKAAGATLADGAQEVFAAADMIVKVKEPQPQECAMLRPGQLLYTYLHLAPDPEQTAALVKSGAVCVAYETITGANGGLPLLAPMSEVAGRMSIQAGAAHLEKSKGGMGVLLGGVPGVAPGHVVILGAGVVGTHALQCAVGAGARVTVLDKNVDRLRQLDLVFGNRITTLYSNALGGGVGARGRPRHRRRADPRRGGAQARHARHDLAHEEGRGRRRRGDRPGRLLRDLARHHARRADLRGRRRRALLRGQHARRGRAHVHVRAQQRDDRPGLALADLGWQAAMRGNPHLKAGLNVAHGKVTFEAVAQALGYDYTPPTRC